MSDTISPRLDLGYYYTNQLSVNLFQYIDDICLVSNSPAACQQLLSLVDRWLHWSGMKVKFPKCQTLTLTASVSKLVDPHLHIDNEHIPFASEPVRFLGRSFTVPQDITDSRTNLAARLKEMLE